MEILRFLASYANSLFMLLLYSLPLLIVAFLIYTSIHAARKTVSFRVTIPKAYYQHIKNDAKSMGITTKDHAADLLSYYYKEKVAQSIRTDYYNRINRQ